MKMTVDEFGTRLHNLELRFDAANDQMLRARKEAMDAGEDVIDAKRALSEARRKGYEEGTITGKNADLRAASEALVLKKEIDALDVAEEDMRLARVHLDEANLEWDYCRYMLRISELAAKAGCIES